MNTLAPSLRDLVVGLLMALIGAIGTYFSGVGALSVSSRGSPPVVSAPTPEITPSAVSKVGPLDAGNDVAALRSQLTQLQAYTSSLAKELIALRNEAAAARSAAPAPVKRLAPAKTNAP